MRLLPTPSATRPATRRRVQRAGHGSVGRGGPVATLCPNRRKALRCIPLEQPGCTQADRYYYGWYDAPPPEPTDRDIKSMVVDRLRENEHTMGDEIHVDVKADVVILTGEVSSPLAKRAAGDDAWDTAGVADVSNQLTVVKAPASRN